MTWSAQARPEHPRARPGRLARADERIDNRRESVEIALVGKYVKLHDAYLSVHEALKHAGIAAGCNVHVRWVDAENMTDRRGARRAQRRRRGAGARRLRLARLGGQDPACRIAREDGIPYLGICLGMHVAVSEFARHVAAWRGELDGDGSRDAASRDRPPAGAEGGRGSRRHDAPRSAGRRAARRHAHARGVRRRGDDRRAPPPSLRGQQRVPPAAARGGTGRQRDVPGGPPRRDHRAARAPVVRRVAVPSRVQVAADAPGAALPRVRRRGARAGRGSASPSKSRSLSVRCSRTSSICSWSSRRSRARPARSAPSRIA